MLVALPNEVVRRVDVVVELLGGGAEAGAAVACGDGLGGVVLVGRDREPRSVTMYVLLCTLYLGSCYALGLS